MEQKYSYVPGLLKVNENFSSVSSTLDLNVLSVLTAVCGISSRFVQVTVVPTGTFNSAGPKLKLSIFTSVASVFCCAAADIFLSPARRPTNATPNVVANKTAVHTILLMVFPSLLFSCFFGTFLWCFLCQRRIHYRQRMLAVHVTHVGDSEHAFQLFGGYFHRAG